MREGRTAAKLAGALERLIQRILERGSCPAHALYCAAHVQCSTAWVCRMCTGSAVRRGVMSAAVETDAGHEGYERVRLKGLLVTASRKELHWHVRTKTQVQTFWRWWQEAVTPAPCFCSGDLFQGVRGAAAERCWCKGSQSLCCRCCRRPLARIHLRTNRELCNSATD